MRLRLVAPAVAVAAAVAVALPQPASAASLAARWSMDELDPASRMADSSGHGNSGTRYDVGLGAPSVTGTRAYSFNGSSSRAVVPSSPSLVPGSRRVEFTLLLQSPAAPPTNPSVNIMQKGLAGDPGGHVKVEWGGAGTWMAGRPMCTFVDNRGRGKRVIGPPLTDGAWHHISCSKSGTNWAGRSTVTILVDGGWRAATTVPLGRISTTAPVSLGAKVYKDGRVDDQYRGLIDFAEVWIG